MDVNKHEILYNLLFDTQINVGEQCLLTLIAVIYLDQMSQVVPSLLYLQPNFVGIHKSIGGKMLL
jgi:hypothetical protein